MAKDIVYWFRTRVGGRELGFVLIRFITQKGVGARESYCTDWGFDYGRAAITARAKKPLSEKTAYRDLAPATLPRGIRRAGLTFWGNSRRRRGRGTRGRWSAMGQFGVDSP